MRRFRVVALVCAMAMVMSMALAGCTNASSSYEPQSKSPEISSPTIGKDGVLRVGVDTSNPPLAGQSSSIIGIDVDIAAALADEFGLKLEIVDVKADAASALKSGTIDLALGVDKSSITADMWASDIYLPTTIALFSTDAATPVPTSASNPKIGAQVSSLSSWAVTNEFGSSALTTEADLASAFKDLSSGKIQFVASDAVVGTYSAHSAGIKVYPIALLQQASGYVAFTSSTNTSLQTALASKIKTLTSNGIINLIEKKWLGTSLSLDNVPLTAGAREATAAANTSSTTDSATSSALQSGEIATNAVTNTAAGAATNTTQQ